MNKKLIGRGSFSQVFLIKEKIDSNIFSFDEDYNYMVIKKIDLGKLIEKYIGKHKANKMSFRLDKEVNTISHQITPWQKNYMEHLEDQKEEDEIQYYKDKLQKLIQSEVDLLYNIYHYNVIKMFDYSININELKFEYILKFEYMNCGDLYKLLKGSYEPFDKYRNEYNGFNNELTLYIIKNVVSGLKFLHDLNIIHRDIKPHNILVHCTSTNEFKTCKDYKIKISDLGFACIHPDDTSPNLPGFLVGDLKKKWKKVCGTPYYMAPEIITNINEDFNYTKSCDIWSLGLSLYEMYFNVLPLTNINNINDIIKFFKSPLAQNVVDSKIKNVKGINNCIKDLLFKSLKIEKGVRVTVDELYSLVNNMENMIIYNSEEDVINNIVISTDNSWRTNNILKQSYIEFDKKVIEIESWVKL